MNIYWVVAHDRYYPSGMLDNVKSTHSTYDEAEKASLRLTGQYDFIEVINVTYLLNPSE
jgi:hypothetical protein